MARLARIVVPTVPHHVTQRGNGRQQTFFSDADYRFYLELLSDYCSQAGVDVWGWCLMPNHVHLVLTPLDEDGLRRALSRVHRAYAGRIHAREKRTGHFWQGRFGCVAMDDNHLVAALAYVALNPVRAGLVERAEAWPWSSVHVYPNPGKSDGVTSVKPVKKLLRPVMALVESGEEDVRFEAIRRSESIGRPVGEDAFLGRVERIAGRSVKPAKRGPKPGVKTEV